MRVMPDSNAIISRVVFPNSFVTKVLNSVEKEHTLIFSSYVLGEVENTIRRKFPESVDALFEFIRSTNHELLRLPDEWRTLIEIPYIRDPKDENVLASAILANADVLITGDKDFDGISVPNLMIMKPRDFWDWSCGQ